MTKVFLCYTTSTKTAVGESKRLAKFPPRPIKKPVSAKAITEDTLKRYPRIMAELAK